MRRLDPVIATIVFADYHPASLRSAADDTAAVTRTRPMAEGLTRL
jgi:hypothetical protein